MSEELRECPDCGRPSAMVVVFYDGRVDRKCGDVDYCKVEGEDAPGIQVYIHYANVESDTDSLGRLFG